MLSNKHHVSATCLWTVIVLVTLWTTTNVVIRLLASIPLVFFLPGSALLRALRIDRSPPERYVLAVGLSIVVTILKGRASGVYAPVSRNISYSARRHKGCSASKMRASRNVSAVAKAGSRGRWWPGA